MSVNADKPARLMNLLLVEDDDDHAEILLRTFQKNRIANTITRVKDGEAALAVLNKQDGYENVPRPDIILLDLKLPRLDGHELLKIIKTDPNLLSIPVVVLTTSDADADRERAYEYHANSYIVKPVNFSRFRQLVHDLSLYWGVWSPPPNS
jgi:CheY-like chemotaxis protein